MGILSFIKSQFIEVIEWTDDSRDTMVYQFPVQGKEIKMGAQLTVRPSQAVVFVNEGQIADVFGPGRYELNTQNMPVLTKLKSWKYGFNSPFKAEVYFVNTRQFTDQKWGTMNPIMMRDAELGMLRLRAYGIYSFRVDDPGRFMTEAFGTSALFSVDGITGQLKRSIVSGISDLLGEFRKPALDLAMYYDELSADACAKVQSRFNSFGLKIETLYIENISLPEEVEKTLDQRTSMGVIGHMGTFTQYQAAQAIRDAAQNEGGGLAGAGVGLGAGAALGSAFAGAMNAQQQPQPVQPQNAAAMAVCPHCGAQAQQGAKFCPGCGKPMTPPAAKCPQCGKDADAGAKFCPHCGASLQGGKCPGCGKDTAPGARFCPDCGAKL